LLVSKALTVNPHPLVFTVRATTCVYSDTLDWVIDFTPHFTLYISRIMDLSNCIICRLYQTVCISLI